MHETFEHTADLGLRARAADLSSLFAESAAALFAAILDGDLAAVAPARPVEVALPSDDLELLLFDWLNALLSHFDGEQWLFSKFDVAVGPEGLKATAWGEPLDRARHELGHEVKAITYHGLRVEQTAEGWLAEVIVDI